MTIALLNGEYTPLEQARISPMDRGFLFGDGIYEVIPSYGGRMVGFDRHMQRLTDGLKAIGMDNPMSAHAWLTTLTELLERNGSGPMGIYLQVTRGVAPQRAHRFPAEVIPTLFAYPFTIEAPSNGDISSARSFSAVTGRDQRWRRCHIKSVALLGNVLHQMEGVNAGADEILLFNERDELTEASACNVFVVIDGEVATPELDSQKLPGITRNMLVDMMRDAGDWRIAERPVTREEVLAADEIWLTSSTKEIGAITMLDGHAVGSGNVGPVWSRAQALFAQHRFDY